MVRINNYLFGPDVRLPFKELFVCSSLYGKEFIRMYQDLPIETPPLFKLHNAGWIRSVEGWNKLTEAQKDLYEVLTFDDTSSPLYLWILDNLKNPLPVGSYGAPSFVFTLHTELSDPEDPLHVKVFFRDLLDEIPDFSNFNFTIILKKAEADPDYSAACFLTSIPFDVEITEVEDKYRIEQELLYDFAVVPGISYHYQILHYNYIILQSDHSNVSIVSIPS